MMGRVGTVTIGLTLLLTAALAVGCGSGDSETTSAGTSTSAHGATTVAVADEPLELYSDNHELGDPELGADRIRITPKGLWTPVYSIPLKQLNEGEGIIAGVDVQMTNCRPSDLAAGSTSSCKGTAPYNLNPRISGRLVLSGGGYDKPSFNGTTLGDEVSFNCTAKLHHCVTALFGKTTVPADQTGDRNVSLFVRATDPQAKPCKPAVPRKCNVLQLTHGQGRLGVARERHPDLYPPVQVTGKEMVRELPLAKTKQQKQSLRKVVYSLELDKAGPVLIKARLLAKFGLDYPTPPLVNKELIIADSPTATTGTTVEPQNGENCQGLCQYLQLGLLPCLTQEDLDAGHKYLNLVTFASRASNFASADAKVRIRPNGYLGVRQYDASLAPKACATG